MWPLYQSWLYLVNLALMTPDSILGFLLWRRWHYDCSAQVLFMWRFLSELVVFGELIFMTPKSIGMFVVFEVVLRISGQELLVWFSLSELIVFC